MSALKMYLALALFFAPLYCELKGIVLIESPEKMVHHADGIVIDIKLPAGEKKLKKLLDLHLCQPLTQEEIDQIVGEITQFYADIHYPLVTVAAPVQDLSSGVLQIVVKEQVLGKIDVQGNQKWSHLKAIKESLRVKVGEPINISLLGSDIDFINRNPFRETSPIIEPGDRAGTANLVIPVVDKTSCVIYAGGDNTGLVDTGEFLKYAGLTWGNCLGLEQVFSYRYVTSTFTKLQGNLFQYLAPLPLKHVLNIYGGYVTIHPNISVPTELNRGYAIQASIRYTIPLLPTTLRQEISGGFDFKRTNTDLIFVPSTDLAPFNQSVNLTQWMIGYYADYHQPKYTLTFFSEVFFSPFAWLGEQSNTDFSTLRPGAQNAWIYGKARFIYFQELPRTFYLSVNLAGQGSSTTLLPSEEYGVGGEYTVRGYHERVLNQENVLLASAELHSPYFRVIPLFTKQPSHADALYFLAFIDYAIGNNITPYPGQPKSNWLGGVGPGVRYDIQDHLSLLLDWGYKLHRGPIIGHRPDRFHFSFTATY